ncbi:hypothetical protein [Alkalihalophilus marmarensis]|uniref:hypothetical protein n=1 Tax=Alkalihalophilus marmarensis TaxID=521377 RepID=UPI002E243640|nr:hypothetical protein [Alkalihalophilus marmarensis]
MLAKQVLAAMPEQESVEEVVERLNERMMDRARDNFGHLIIEPSDFVGFFHHKQFLMKHYRNEGFHVRDLESELIVTWKH